MKLAQLEPEFLRREERPDHVYFVPVATIAEAQGVQFLCPKCFVAKGGPIGTHGVICWSRSAGVPDSAEPGPGRWRLVGSSLEDLSLMEEPGFSRSVALKCECLEPDGKPGAGWHGYITNGEATTS